MQKKDMDDQFKNADTLKDQTPKVKDPNLYSPEMEAKVKAEVAKYPRIPAKYVAFTVRFKCFWIGVNVLGILTSTAFAAGSVLILGSKPAEEEENLDPTGMCMSMYVVCWAMFMLHICNFLFNCLALCGLEKRICISQVLLALVIFDGVVLIWAQATYFKSQSVDCNIKKPDIYFWLMGEILFFYLLSAFVVCYFFRKFC